MTGLKIAKESDPNYLATVVKLLKIEKHPNADRLSITEIFGNTIIIGNDDYKEGDIVVYFPVESAIKAEFLSWANLFDKAALNADETTKGYFESKGRVRAVSLRSVPSQGFLFKVSKLAEYYKIDENNFKVGHTFNLVGDDVLVTKYVKGDKNKGEGNAKKSRVPKWLDTTIGVFPRPMRRGAYIFVNKWYNRDHEGIKSRLIDGQFRLHYSTPQLGQNIWIIKPDDDITITQKLHGCASTYSNIECIRPFDPIRSLVNYLGGNVPTTEHKFIYSSRNILKNRRDGKFTDDVWGRVAESLCGKIPENILIYGELVGWSSQNKAIQKNYTYSVTQGNVELRVYRIVENTQDGPIEFGWLDIEKFCMKYKLTTVPRHYTGRACGLFDIPIDDNWNSVFISRLKETFLDKLCIFCNNDVINEGIVLRIESRNSKPAFKFKSPLFNIQESKSIDGDDYEDMDKL